MSTCRTCRAPILWAKTLTGIPIPLDPEPVDGGNVELQNGVAHVVKPEPGVKRLVSHFTTCAHAKLWRRQPQDKARRTRG
jgi:hypothetical protein